MNIFARQVTLLGAFLASSAWADEATIPAVWKTQELMFKYSGFMTHYSCTGLKDKMQVLLPALGARKDDLQIRYALCGPDSSRPYDVISLKIKLSTLQLASDKKAAAIAAHWQHVDIARAARYERGDCELAEQVRQSLLPLFITRNIEAQDGGCAPRSAPTGTPVLRLDVLLPGADQAIR